MLSRTISELSQLIVQIFDTLVFLSHHLGGSRTTYNVHLGLIGNRVVDFLIPMSMSANKLFC